jgi:hypothetical protein
MEKKVEIPTDSALQQPVLIRSFSIEDLRKAYEIGRTDARISEREGRYYDTFDEWFSQNCTQRFAAIFSCGL